MPDLSDLPENFEKLRACPPLGFTISERIIDPVVVVGRVGNTIVARLGGTRTLNGVKHILRAPSNSHAWVIDGNTIRPIPRDASSFFTQKLKGSDPNDLQYSEAIRLIREAGTLMCVESEESFRMAGMVAAGTLAGEMTIPGLTATLFPYQARGVQWMWETISHTGGLILADEMGLGKTLQVIALLLIEPPKNWAPALIICPTSLIANWEREIARFAPTLTVMVHRGPNRAGFYRGLQVASIVISTYDTMANDISIFSSFEWSWVICDEAQAIKNPDSNRRQAIVTIPRRRTIPMTGTPVENSLLDLWSLTDVAIPGLLGTRREFELAYPDSIESAQEIGRLTDPVILKRRVADVAGDLPERIDFDIPLELDDELVDHYLQVRKTTIAKYPVAGALVATLQLQLVCAHPWLRNIDTADPGDENVAIHPTHAYPLMTSKMERTVSIIREAFFNSKREFLRT